MARTKRQVKKQDTEELVQKEQNEQAAFEKEDKVTAADAEMAVATLENNITEGLLEPPAAEKPEAEDEIPPLGDEIPTSLEALAQLGATANKEVIAGEPVEAEIPAFVFPGGQGLEALAKLGPALKSRREEMGLSFVDITHRTCMAQSTIVALETQPLDKLDAPFYIKNRLSLYAKVLSIDPKAMQEFFDSCLTSDVVQTCSGRQNSSARRWLIIGAVVLVLAAVAVVISLK